MRDYEAHRAKYRRVLAASPLPEETKARLMQSAQYMADRLCNVPARPPAHWTAEQIHEFEVGFARQEFRDAMLTWAVEGWIRLHGEANELED